MRVAAAVGVILTLIACGSPVGVDPVVGVNAVAPAGTLHLDHAAFSSYDGVNPILHAADYFYSANARGGNAVYDLTLPVGTGLTGLRAYVYGDRVGDFGGADSRSLYLTLYRFGMGPCPTMLNEVRYYCPMNFVSLILGYDGWRDPDGWQILSDLRSSTIESGYTYQIIVNLSAASLRVGYVEFDITDPVLASR